MLRRIGTRRQKARPISQTSSRKEPASATATSSPAESASTAPLELASYKSPDGSVELMLRLDMNDEDDQINGPGHGKHYLLRDLKTGTETEFSKVPGFYGAAGLLHNSEDKDLYFLFDGSLRVAFFDLHLNSTDGDTVFALDFSGPRFVRLSPNWAMPIRVAGRGSLSHVYGKPLCANPGEQQNGELLLHGTLGRETE